MTAQSDFRRGGISQKCLISNYMTEILKLGNRYTSGNLCTSGNRFTPGNGYTATAQVIKLLLKITYGIPLAGWDRSRLARGGGRVRGRLSPAGTGPGWREGTLSVTALTLGGGSRTTLDARGWLSPGRIAFNFNIVFFLNSGQ